MSPLRAPVVAATLALLLGTAGCKEAGTLELANFAVGPSPAFPGDEVRVEFLLNLFPDQRYTIFVFIDNEEYLQVERDTPPPESSLVQVPLGDAAELIDAYGTGQHAVQVEVYAHVSDVAIRSSIQSLELREAP